MSGKPWYAFYPDAYERDAGTLSYVQDSAYRRMLDHYYKSGEPLPLDHGAIYRACRAMKRDERAAINHCLQTFFERRPDGYHQARADEEIARSSDISAKRAGAANKRHSKPDAIAQQLDTHLHSTSTSTPSEAKASSVSRTPAKPHISKALEVPGFAEFYAEFPLHKARPAAAKAYARALSRAAPQVLLDGAKRYAKSRTGEDANFTKHPATWLNNDCWLDEIVSRETHGGRNGGQSTSFGSTLSRRVEARNGEGLFDSGSGPPVVAAIEDHSERDRVEDGGFGRTADAA